MHFENYPIIANWHYQLTRLFMGDNADKVAIYQPDQQEQPAVILLRSTRAPRLSYVVQLLQDRADTTVTLSLCNKVSGAALHNYYVRPESLQEAETLQFTADTDLIHNLQSHVNHARWSGVAAKLALEKIVARQAQP